MTTVDEPLIHIGYHKTGTTWLQRRIFNDASMGFAAVPPEILERTFVTTNPFTFDARAARAAVEPHLGSAGVGVLSHERLSGRPLQGSIDARAIADRLAATFPRARILIGIRTQETMLLSLYKEITTNGLDPRSYTDFLSHRLSDPKVPPVLEVLEYHHLIGYYQGCFGADRVLVLPFETLHEPAAFVGRIADFVGIASPPDVPRDRENPGLPTAAVALARFLNVVTRTLGLERWLVGPTAKPKLVGARRAALRALGGRATRAMSSRVERRWIAATNAHLGDRYAQSNRATERLTGLDLRALGYRVAEGTD